MSEFDTHTLAFLAGAVLSPIVLYWTARVSRNW